MDASEPEDIPPLADVLADVSIATDSTSVEANPSPQSTEQALPHAEDSDDISGDDVEALTADAVENEASQKLGVEQSGSGNIDPDVSAPQHPSEPPEPTAGVATEEDASVGSVPNDQAAAAENQTSPIAVDATAASDASTLSGPARLLPQSANQQDQIVPVAVLRGTSAEPDPSPPHPTPLADVEGEALVPKTGVKESAIPVPVGATSGLSVRNSRAGGGLRGTADKAADTFRADRKPGAVAARAGSSTSTPGTEADVRLTSPAVPERTPNMHRSSSARMREKEREEGRITMTVLTQRGLESEGNLLQPIIHIQYRTIPRKHIRPITFLFFPGNAVRPPRPTSAAPRDDLCSVLATKHNPFSQSDAELNNVFPASYYSPTRMKTGAPSSPMKRTASGGRGSLSSPVQSEGSSSVVMGRGVGKTDGSTDGNAENAGRPPNEPQHRPSTLPRQIHKHKPGPTLPSIPGRPTLPWFQRRYGRPGSAGSVTGDAHIDPPKTDPADVNFERDGRGDSRTSAARSAKSGRVATTANAGAEQTSPPVDARLSSPYSTPLPLARVQPVPLKGSVVLVVEPVLTFGGENTSRAQKAGEGRPHTSYAYTYRYRYVHSPSSTSRSSTAALGAVSSPADGGVVSVSRRHALLAALRLKRDMRVEETYLGYSAVDAQEFVRKAKWRRAWGACGVMNLDATHGRPPSKAAGENPHILTPAEAPPPPKPPLLPIQPPSAHPPATPPTSTSSPSPTT
ncbi:uncharacterized protein EV422DRAFT_503711 [Fimicolochytrium jonesii]|uniref:uncharacterized protein n=1 Tax=Fimicolochytrium jonesii TaxID=1396493 RepID=UPI0022FE31C2|nr:uncharacterized protein EV422DRAFT_503711 [Fimicolochytrium jonesii]KAI8824928.1 hypothetical protein EV422DRAFT_503711 [Fimicolochytrium jonesii]